VGRRMLACHLQCLVGRGKTPFIFFALGGMLWLCEGAAPRQLLRRDDVSAATYLWALVPCWRELKRLLKMAGVVRCMNRGR